MKICKYLYVLLLLAWVPAVSTAQALRPLYFVSVAADHDDWNYKQGEPVKFIISVSQHNNFLKKCAVSIEIGPEAMTPTYTETREINGQVTIDGGTMNTPGFLRCVVVANIDGKKYRGLATAAFDRFEIKPTTETPADFKTFWAQAIEENQKLPMDPKLTLLPDRCTEKTNVYQLNIQNYRAGARIYGILCVPKKPGKYPAIFEPPGAGVRAYAGDIDLAEKGIITLQIGIHGIPVTSPDPNVYLGLFYGALSDYMYSNLDNRDKYYFKRVYLGCLRCMDYLCDMPEFDGTNLATFGGSQGGALSIVTAAMDKRVKYMVAMYPAMSDLTGYLHNRAGGWPHMFNKYNAPAYATADKIETSKYYDAVNFARLIKIPGFYSWGYNDEVCPPTSAFSAYNVITAPKELFVTQEAGHWLLPETQAKASEWLVNKLVIKK